MENDSLSTVLPDSVPVVDSVESGVSLPEVHLPSPEELGISITSGNKDIPLVASVGDTVDFPVTVSWSVNGSALLVVPTSSANAKGLSQVGVSQESARAVKDGKEIASITFTYKIVVQDTGHLNIPVMRFEIPTQMGQPLELRSESVPLQSEMPSNWMPFAVGGVVALVVLLAGFWRLKRRAAGRAALCAKRAAENQVREKMLVLKQRVNSADSRQWLLELEAICKEFVVNRMKEAGKAVSGDMNLDALLTSGALEKMGSKEGWKDLLDEFAHARYGGGKRDGFENKETWKLAMKLMGISDE